MDQRGAVRFDVIGDHNEIESSSESFMCLPSCYLQSRRSYFLRISISRWGGYHRPVLKSYIFRLQIPQNDMVDFDLCAVLQVESRFGLKISQLEEWTALKIVCPRLSSLTHRPLATSANSNSLFPVSHHHCHRHLTTISSPSSFITRSYAALRAADLDWIVGPGYNLGWYILGCSQRLALCLRHSARIGPDLLCHPSWKKLDDDKTWNSDATSA